MLFFAAFLAGMLNALAGGGSFLTFPALVHFGVLPVTANATSAVVLLPGYVTATGALLPQLRKLSRSMLLGLCLVALAGGLMGALLLLVTSNKTFQQIVPYLLLASTAMFAAGPAISRYLQRRGDGSASSWLIPGVFCVAVLGGYFNGGLGVVLLAALSMAGMTDMPLMNSIKNVVSLTLSVIAVVTFALAGIVEWQWALPMMVAAAFGGFFGGKLASRLPNHIVRIFVIVTGLIMSVLFFRAAG
ncbi:sulfite exporter TauE/SafE family protein [Rhizobium sp. BE258]|uniref:sulfite exporter TauE/SafE family protein n=1 Tax=Rhizobium sp. BE258 TaxID=2817722 RepID=UPI00286B3F89|nr:sulfite exporter TauE/SafE family protein [Rhizobium sp. BE258]